MEAHAGTAAELLKAMAHPVRLLVLCHLIDGERSVGALLATVSLSSSALSQHLAVLRGDGLVSARRDAQSVYYSLPEGPAQRIIETLHGIYCAPQRGQTAPQRGRTRAVRGPT